MRGVLSESVDNVNGIERESTREIRKIVKSLETRCFVLIAVELNSMIFNPIIPRIRITPRVTFEDSTINFRIGVLKVSSQLTNVA